MNDFVRNIKKERRIEFSTDLAAELGKRRKDRSRGTHLNLQSAQLQEAILRFADFSAADLTLTLVGVAWKQIIGTIRHAQPEVKLRPAGKLATLSVRRARDVRDWPLETSQVFAALPETELRESPLQTS